jgi:hypothetical protein
MTEDAPSTGSSDKPSTPADQPPAVAPADASGDRPMTQGPAPAPRPQPATAIAGGPPPPGGTTTAVMDPPPPSSSAAPATDKPGRPGIGLLPIAIGVGLVAAAIVLSSTRARSDGDLDWSNYSVGLAATAVLLLFALLAIVLGSSGSRGREELVTWPGSFGILGVGLMIGIGLEDIDGSEDWLPYLVGGVVALLSVFGYAAVRRGAFVVTAILGLGIAYIQLADDVLIDIGEDDDQAIIAAATIAVFVLAVTAGGWLLRTRAISGVVAGVIGVVGFNAVMLALGLAQFFDSMFGGPDVTMTGGQTEEGGSFFFVSTDGGPDYDNDVYIILAMAAVLTLLWALAAALDGNPGFTLLAIAMPATLVPDATFVLMVEHPTWWGGAFAAAGGVLLGLVALKQLLARKRPH